MRMPVLIPQSKYRKSKDIIDRLFNSIPPEAVTAGFHIGSSENDRIFDAIGMPCWYFDKQQLRDTPSIRDGMSFETERRYRKEGARFIIACGTNMSLGHNTMATGVVYFHRFYMFHSFKNFPRYVTACCCLFLAGKVEETPKKCRDIIRTARTLLEDNHFFSFGEDPKEEVMTLERILLQTIKFDLQVEHPYTFLVRYAKCFKGDQAKLQKMVQMAWNFVNDSLSTVVCLQWEPEIIAVALIHLASKLSKFTVGDWNGRQPNHTRWWDMFVAEVTMEILEDICHQVLDLYQNNQKESNCPPSPPQLPPSRAELPKLAPQKKTSGSSSSSGHSPVRKALKQSHPSSASSAISSIGPSTHSASTATQHHGVNNATNHIQPIRSLANSAQVPIQQLDLPHASISATGSSAGYHPAAHQHNVYRPPPQPSQAANSTPNAQPIQSMYGTSNMPAPPLGPAHNYGTASGSASSAHLPPLPPQPVTAPYSANSWPQSLPSAPHYASNLPPMPPPQSGPGPNNSGYYHHQQQHHPRHHSQHYTRQQRY